MKVYCSAEVAAEEPSALNLLDSSSVLMLAPSEPLEGASLLTSGRGFVLSRTMVPRVGVSDGDILNFRKKVDQARTTHSAPRTMVLGQYEVRVRDQAEM